MNRRRAAGVVAAAGGAGALVAAAQALILIPLYLHALGPRLYGAWLGAADFLVWLQGFDFGLPNLMLQRIGAAVGRREEGEVVEWFRAGLFALGAIAAGFLGVAFAVAPHLPGWMGIAGEDGRLLSRAFGLGAAASAVLLVSNTFVALGRGLQSPARTEAATIAGYLAGFAASLAAILSGLGLWAVPVGLAARALVSFGGGLAFVLGRLGVTALRPPRLTSPRLRELLRLAPVTSAGGIASIVMSQSETALVAILARPELAATYNLTRKAAELLRGLLDTIAFGAYGGFSHLVASTDRPRALAVWGEVRSLRLSAATLAAAGYLALNEAFVTRLFGAERFGGFGLTVLFAAQMILTGQSFLLGYLYRATGRIVSGSLVLVAEAAIRVPLMAALFVGFGLGGPPVASMATAAATASIFGRMTRRELLPSASTAATSPAWGLWATRAALLAGAAAVARLGVAPALPAITFAGLAIVLLGGTALFAADPALRSRVTAWRVREAA